MLFTYIDDAQSNTNQIYKSGSKGGMSLSYMASYVNPWATGNFQALGSVGLPWMLRGLAHY